MSCNNEIDVHVLLPDTWTPQTAAWRDECMESLRDHPINLHQIQGIKGNLRQARLNGYSQGTAPYVSFVDPDDVVSPCAFESALNTLQQAGPNVCGAYTNYSMLYEETGHKKVRQFNNRWSRIKMVHDMRLVHQLIVVKRDILIPTYHKYYDSIPLVGNELFHLAVYLAKEWNWIADPMVGYTWRVHPEGTHHTLKAVMFRRDQVLAVQQWALRELGLPVWDYHQILRYTM